MKSRTARISGRPNHSSACAAAFASLSIVTGNPVASLIWVVCLLGALVLTVLNLLIGAFILVLLIGSVVSEQVALYETITGEHRADPEPEEGDDPGGDVVPLPKR